MGFHTFPRLHCASALSAGAVITLGDEQVHYLLHVMRMKNGDAVRLFNAKDGEWVGSFQKSGKHSVAISLHEQIRTPHSEHDLWLCPALIKKAPFDYMVEKATELGVMTIQPILTARTQIREANTERLHAISIEAAEQSERLSIPIIQAAITLQKLTDNWPRDRHMIVCAEWGDAEPIEICFRRLASPTTKIAILTGPEGGFTGEELTALRTMPQTHFIRLGPRILRADTAAISALTIWQALSGDWTISTTPDR